MLSHIYVFLSMSMHLFTPGIYLPVVCLYIYITLYMCCLFTDVFIHATFPNDSLSDDDLVCLFIGTIVSMSIVLSVSMKKPLCMSTPLQNHVHVAVHVSVFVYANAFVYA